MLIYYTLFLVLSLFSLFDISVKKYQRDFLFIFSIFILFLFSGIRYNCDNDYVSYISIFKSIPSIDKLFTSLHGILFWNGIEIGFVTLISVLKLLNFEVSTMFLISSFITFCFLYKALIKLSEYPTVSLFLYFSLTFFFLPFMQIRFGIASSIFLYAFYFLSKRKYINYILLILLATLFHITAIIGLFYLMFHFVKLTPIRSFILLGLSVLFIFIVDFRAVFSFIIINMGTQKHINYLFNNDAGSSIVGVVVRIIILIPFIFYKKVFSSKMAHYDVVLSMSIFGILVGSIFYRMEILSRFYTIFFNSFIIIIPSYFYILKKNIQNRFFIYILIFSYCLLELSKAFPYLKEYKTIFF